MAVRLDMAGTVALARWWWTFIIRGLLAIAFGVLAFFAPGLGIAVLVGLFAAWALIDGVANLITGFGSRNRDKSWWLEILEGVVSIIAGIIALAFPVLAAEILVIIIAAWAIVTGIFEIIAAFRLREQIKGEFWLGLAGLASILFGVILFVFPGVGALSLVWLIGSFALVFGVFLVILGWRLRGVNEMAKIDAAHDYSR
ncbi:MAG TPA: HdeD family acid-resistance protein [Candidatus Limnocylindria bacterium]|nr:HdeD family acid-resistance protein [Candidatus Limnocylindria bacterium]